MLSDAENNKTSVWISYGFIHFAYFLFLATPLFLWQDKRNNINDRTLYPITAAYFLIELIAGVTLILVAPDTIKVTIIIQVILAAIFIGWLLVYLIANEHTANSTGQRDAELQYVKESSAKLHSVLQQITDHDAAKKVERVYDLIHSSPVKSNANVYSLEQQVINEIERLESVVNQNDTQQIFSIAEKIYRFADERNRQLKINNR